MGIEFELKYRATPETLEAMRQSCPGKERVISMETTYYDTPSGSLSARFCTLRRRMENDISVCTLKTPAANFGRNEFEVECDCIEGAIDALCKLSGDETLPPLLAEGVVPVCGAQFTRIAKTVVLADCVVELALDRGILTGSGKEQPLCEAEVELKEGSRESACAYALQLATAFGLTLERASKFRRAQKLAASGR